jgi:hypothetical protein
MLPALGGSYTVHGLHKADRMLDLDVACTTLKYRFQTLARLMFHCFGRNPANRPRNEAKTKVTVKGRDATKPQEDSKRC